MSLAALRDAIDLLTTKPFIWMPGIACGLLAALLWAVLFFFGTFYAARLFIVILLAAVFLGTVIFIAIRQDGSNSTEILKVSAAYFFRVLTPALVIAFGTILVFTLVILTLALFGMQPDAGLMTFLVFGVVLPTIMLTFFFDCAAVFDGKKVFESLQRSIEIVTANMFSVILFYTGYFLIFCTISFTFFVVWTAALADKLEPLTQLNETQIATLTSDKIVSLIGQNGLIISAICIFAGVALLMPVLYTYKACFYKIVSGSTLPIQQTIGEYDSKGRWYKY